MTTPAVSPLLRHRPTAEMVGVDPCGGAYVRDCACGWRCPPRRLPEEAQALYDAHVANPAAPVPAAPSLVVADVVREVVAAAADVLPIPRPAPRRSLVARLIDLWRAA